MVTQLQPVPIIPSPAKVIYPDRDGKRMAENTEHFELIFWIEKNLELIFADRPQVFVAGDLLWYPIEGNNRVRQAPDVMVAFDRPKGYRGSYQQWEEGNVPPQVVFEILSPGNRVREMARKFSFYQLHGVEEYYIYKPRKLKISGWQGGAGRLTEIPNLQNWVSPHLGVSFEMTKTGLQLYHPDGCPFLGFLELNQRLQVAQEQLQIAKVRVQTAEAQAQAAEALLAQERQRSQALLDRLQSLGITPESL